MMNHSFRGKCKILLTISALLAVSLTHGCLLPESGDEFYSPVFDVYFEYIYLEPIANTLTEHNFNISYDYRDNGSYYGLLFLFLENRTYGFWENNTYTTPSTILSILDQRPHYGIWATIRLAFEAHEEYRFPSRKEAMNASYLLEPSVKLFYDLLNATGNPMPSEVKYVVW